MKAYAIYSITGCYEDTVTQFVEAHTNKDIAEKRKEELELEEKQRIAQYVYCRECPYRENYGEDFTNGGSKEIIDAMNRRCPNSIGHHYMDANGYLHCVDYQDFRYIDSFYIDEIEVIEDGDGSM